MYCGLCKSNFANFLRVCSKGRISGFRTSNVRATVFILGNSIYIVYYKRTDFYIGRCISGNGDWRYFLKKRRYLNLIFPASLFFTEVL